MDRLTELIFITLCLLFSSRIACKETYGSPIAIVKCVVQAMGGRHRQKYKDVK